MIYELNYLKLQKNKLNKRVKPWEIPLKKLIFEGVFNQKLRCNLKCAIRRKAIFFTGEVLIFVIIALVECCIFLNFLMILWRCNQTHLRADLFLFFVQSV